MNILLIDDHPILRSGVCSLIERYFPACLISEADTLARAIDILNGSAEIDIIVLDLGLPDSSGLDGLLRLRRRAPATPVIVLSGLNGPEHRIQALRCGAAAFVAKDGDAFAILSALRAVALGEAYTPANPDTLAALVPTFGLSERQREILDLCCERLSNKEIGRRLGISDNTVRSHLAMLFRRFGVTSRAALAALAQRTPARHALEHSAAGVARQVRRRARISGGRAEAASSAP